MFSDDCLPFMFMGLVDSAAFVFVFDIAVIDWTDYLCYRFEFKTFALCC